MRVGVCLPQFTTDASAVVDAARTIEVQGYDAVSVFDHLTPLGGPPTRPILEAFTTLAAVTVATERVDVLPLVARAGLRPAATVAHMVRTMASLSGGRFVLGLGSGDSANAGEDASFGLPVLDAAGRLQQVAEAVAAVREAAPEVPIWLGGTGRGIRRLAGEIADGWNVWGLPVEEVVVRGADVRASAASAHRPPPFISWAGPVLLAADARTADDRAAAWRAKGTERSSTQLVTGEPSAVMTQLRRLADADVGLVVLSFVGGGAAAQRELFAREVLPGLHEEGR